MTEDASEAPRRSSRNPEQLRARLQAWLATKLPAEAAPQLSEISSPSATGMSSETLLFEAAWSHDCERRNEAFVARVEPDPADAPVFPVYDLESQFRLLRLVAEHSDVPVPRVRWLELDPTRLGAPFFVMDRVEGRVPPDIMPYPLGSWLSEASPAEQRALQDATVRVLAQLHAIDVEATGADFLAFDLPGETPLRRHVEHWRRYYDWVREDRRHPVIERGFDWLAKHWPHEEGPAAISWGDARIGNVLYRGFGPVAVLDWEMAGLAPPEVDLAWLCFLHRFFQDIAEQAGQTGMPDFLRAEDVCASYARESGVAPRDFAFYEVYAAVRHAIVMARIHGRRVQFGEGDWGDDVDAVVPHRERLERMLAE